MYKFGPKEDISLDTNVPETQPSIIIPSEVPYFPSGGLYQPSDPIISSAHVPQFLGATNAQDLHRYADAGNTWPLYSSALPVMSGVGATLSEELIIRLLCPSDRIGRVIGKGGSTIKSIRQESGARIDVDDSKANYNECLIIITTTEVHCLPFLIINSIIAGDVTVLAFVIYYSVCLISLFACES